MEGTRYAFSGWQLSHNMQQIAQWIAVDNGVATCVNISALPGSSAKLKRVIKLDGKMELEQILERRKGGRDGSDR
jgi:hypothetical protein